MTISVDPVIGKLGPLEFRWYGVIMAIAVVVGVWVMSRQLKYRNIAAEHALGIAIFGIPCGVLGARLVHVFDQLGYYIDNPSKLLSFKLVGLAIYGVVGGGLVGLAIYCRWKKLPLLRVIDSTALAFPVGQIIGKCANIINGDTPGKLTDSAWNLVYTKSPFIGDALLGKPTHPAPMYEQIWLVIMVVVLLLTMKRLKKVDGLAILSYAWLYSLGRFVISFWRAAEPRLWGLQQAQLIALAVLILAPALAVWLVHRSQRKEAAKGSRAAVAAAAAGSSQTAKSTEKRPAPEKESAPTQKKAESKTSAGAAAGKRQASADARRQRQPKKRRS